MSASPVSSTVMSSVSASALAAVDRRLVAAEDQRHALRFPGSRTGRARRRARRRPAAPRSSARRPWPCSDQPAVSRMLTNASAAPSCSSSAISANSGCSWVQATVSAAVAWPRRRNRSSSARHSWRAPLMSRLWQARCRPPRSSGIVPSQEHTMRLRPRAYPYAGIVSWWSKQLAAIDPFASRWTAAAIKRHIAKPSRGWARTSCRRCTWYESRSWRGRLATAEADAQAGSAAGLPGHRAARARRCVRRGGRGRAGGRAPARWSGRAGSISSRSPSCWSRRSRWPTARRALFAGMNAAADALAAHCPPEKPITFAWPDTILLDGGLVGGVPARLARDAHEDGAAGLAGVRSDAAADDACRRAPDGLRRRPHQPGGGRLRDSRCRAS